MAGKNREHGIASKQKMDICSVHQTPDEEATQSASFSDKAAKMAWQQSAYF